jgi:hypothetical protein
VTHIRERVEAANRFYNEKVLPRRTEREREDEEKAAAAREEQRLRDEAQRVIDEF